MMDRFSFILASSVLPKLGSDEDVLECNYRMEMCWYRHSFGIKRENEMQGLARYP